MCSTMLISFSIVLTTISRYEGGGFRNSPIVNCVENELIEFQLCSNYFPFYLSTFRNLGTFFQHVSMRSMTQVRLPFRPDFDIDISTKSGRNRVRTAGTTKNVRRSQSKCSGILVKFHGRNLLEISDNRRQNRDNLIHRVEYYQSFESMSYCHLF